jgi:hypothetical protein
MKKVIYFSFGIGSFFFFIKSAFLSLLYLYKTGGFLLCLLGFFGFPFMVVFVPFLAGLQQGNWGPLLSGLTSIGCGILAVLFSEK